MYSHIGIPEVEASAFWRQLNMDQAAIYVNGVWVCA